MDSSMFNTVVGTHSIRVKWDSSAVSATEFAIKYRISDTRKFLAVPEITQNQDNDYDVEIDQLMANTQYDVLVFSVDDDGNNHPLFKTKCKTNETQLDFLMDSLTSTVDKTCCPVVYHVNPRYTESIRVPSYPGDQHTLTSGKASDKEDRRDVIRVCDMSKISN